MASQGYFEEEDFYGIEEESKKEIKGITDKVESFSYTGMSYPCVVLKEGFKCPEHKMIVLSRMVKMSSREKKDISLYFNNGDDLFKIGTLGGSQVKAFYEVVGEENVRVFYDDGKELLGSKKYVLSTN